MKKHPYLFRIHYNFPKNSTAHPPPPLPRSKTDQHNQYQLLYDSRIKLTLIHEIFHLIRISITNPTSNLGQRFISTHPRCWRLSKGTCRNLATRLLASKYYDVIAYFRDNSQQLFDHAPLKNRYNFTPSFIKLYYYDHFAQIEFI